MGIGLSGGLSVGQHAAIPHTSAMMSSWLIMPVKLVDETVNNSNVFQNDDDLFFPVGANEIWDIFVFFRYNTSAVADLKWLFTVPAGSLVRGTSTAQNQATEVDWTVLRLIDGNGTTSISMHRGVLITGAAAGTVQLQWAQNTAEVSNTVMLAGAHLIAHRLI